MTPKNGVIAFNDCGWAAVEKAIRFVETHRRYREVDVGLPRSYDGKNSVIKEEPTFVLKPSDTES